MSELGKNLISSANVSLALLKAKRSMELLGCVVAEDGSGHYSTLAGALDAGEEIILLRPGTYSLTSDYSLINQSIIGENPDTCIINLTHTLKLGGGGAHTSSGTIKPTNNSSALVGSGTSFTTVGGSRIFTILDGGVGLARVSSVTNNTSMELRGRWFGRSTDKSGADWALTHDTLESLTSGAMIANVTINHNPSVADTAIELNGVYNSVFNCVLNGSSGSPLSTVLRIGSASDNRASHCIVSDCRIEAGSRGVYLGYADNIIISNISVNLCTYGLYTGNDCSRVSVLSCRFFACSYGVYAVAGDGHLLFFDCLFSHTYAYGAYINVDYTTLLCCKFYHCHEDSGSSTAAQLQVKSGFFTLDSCFFSDGIIAVHMQTDDDNIRITNCDFYNYSGYGIYSLASDDIDQLTIDGCTFSGSSAGAYGISVLGGEHHIISNCHFRESHDQAVVMGGDFVTVQGCTFDGATGTFGGIQLTGDYCTLQGCTFKYLTGSIDIDGNYTTVTGNAIYDDQDNGIMVGGTYNTITGNAINGAADDGIRIFSDYSTVVGNVVYGCTDHGIFITGVSDRTNCSCNVSRGSTTANLTDIGSNTELAGANITT